MSSKRQIHDKILRSVSIQAQKTMNEIINRNDKSFKRLNGVASNENVSAKRFKTGTGSSNGERGNFNGLETKSLTNGSKESSVFNEAKIWGDFVSLLFYGIFDCDSGVQDESKIKETIDKSFDKAVQMHLSATNSITSEEIEEIKDAFLFYKMREKNNYAFIDTDFYKQTIRRFNKGLKNYLANYRIKPKDVTSMYVDFLVHKRNKKNLAVETIFDKIPEKLTIWPYLYLYLRAGRLQSFEGLLLESLPKHPLMKILLLIFRDQGRAAVSLSDFEILEKRYDDITRCKDPFKMFFAFLTLCDTDITKARGVPSDVRDFILADSDDFVWFYKTILYTAERKSKLFKTDLKSADYFKKPLYASYLSSPPFKSLNAGVTKIQTATQDLTSFLNVLCYKNLEKLAFYTTLKFAFDKKTNILNQKDQFLEADQSQKKGFPPKIGHETDEKRNSVGEISDFQSKKVENRSEQCFVERLEKWFRTSETNTSEALFDIKRDFLLLKFYRKYVSDNVHSKFALQMLLESRRTGYFELLWNDGKGCLKMLYEDDFGKLEGLLKKAADKAIERKDLADALAFCCVSQDGNKIGEIYFERILTVFENTSQCKRRISRYEGFFKATVNQSKESLNLKSVPKKILAGTVGELKSLTICLEVLEKIERLGIKRAGKTLIISFLSRTKKTLPSLESLTKKISSGEFDEFSYTVNESLRKNVLRRFFLRTISAIGCLLENISRCFDNATLDGGKNSFLGQLLNTATFGLFGYRRRNIQQEAKSLAKELIDLSDAFESFSAEERGVIETVRHSVKIV